MPLVEAQYKQSPPQADEADLFWLCGLGGPVAGWCRVGGWRHGTGPVSPGGNTAAAYPPGGFWEREPIFAGGWHRVPSSRPVGIGSALLMGQ
jgi:hypothetical protein